MASTATNSFGYFLEALNARQRSELGRHSDPAGAILLACNQPRNFNDLQRLTELAVTTLLDLLGKLENAGLLASQGAGEAKQWHLTPTGVAATSSMLTSP